MRVGSVSTVCSTTSDGTVERPAGAALRHRPGRRRRRTRAGRSRRRSGSSCAADAARSTRSRRLTSWATTSRRAPRFGSSSRRTTWPSSGRRAVRAPRRAAVKVASPHWVGGYVLTKPKRVLTVQVPSDRTAPRGNRGRSLTQLMFSPQAACAPRSTVNTTRRRVGAKTGWCLVRVTGRAPGRVTGATASVYR